MTNIDARIKFSGIEVLAKDMKERLENENIPPKDFKYSVSATSKVNPSLKVVFIKVDVKIIEVDKSESSFTISTLCAFEIENFSVIVEKKSDSFYQVPPEVDAMLKSVALSTTRGIIFSELKGTFLFNAILPIIIFTPEQVKMAQEAISKNK